MVPCEAGPPVRLASLALIWEHVDRDQIDFDELRPDMVFELHIHHVHLDGGVVNCLVVNSSGPCAGVGLPIDTWRALPVPSELLEVPESPAGLLDAEWEPFAHEPGLNTETRLPTSANFSGRTNQYLCVEDYPTLEKMWISKRPIVVTLRWCDEILGTWDDYEIVHPTTELIAILERYQGRKNVRKHDRMRVRHLLRVIGSFIERAYGGQEYE